MQIIAGQIIGDGLIKLQYVPSELDVEVTLHENTSSIFGEWNSPILNVSGVNYSVEV